MFAQMKSRRRSPSRPCPCRGTCDCHKPKEKFPWEILLVFPLMFPIIVPGVFILIVGLAPSPPVPHIQVNGKDCVIQHVTDHCTSTGACSGHDVAICPTENK